MSHYGAAPIRQNNFVGSESGSTLPKAKYNRNASGEPTQFI